MNKTFESAILPGTVLHGNSFNYKIIKALGQGSFGITYLASIKMKGELGEIETYVALKEFFMAEINGRDNSAVTASSNSGIFEKYKQKFTTEAVRLSQLNHPNIVKVVESFEANNTVYYAMEYIDGGSLDDYIKQRGRLPEQEVMGIATQITDALGYMHSMNMLHLDLKPSNIMMRHGSPVLIDFGLAKQYDDNGQPESSTTIGGGTPGYAPIEQSNYNGNPSSRASFPVTMDIYALGATFYKMLLGERPPEAFVILNDGFPAQELQAGNVSEKTCKLVETMMHPLWRNRYQTTQQVLNIISPGSVVTPPPRPGNGGNTGSEKTEVLGGKRVPPVPPVHPGGKVVPPPLPPGANGGKVVPPPLPPGGPGIKPVPPKKSSTPKWLLPVLIAAACIVLIVGIAIFVANDSYDDEYYYEEEISEEPTYYEDSTVVEEYYDEQVAYPADDEEYPVMDCSMYYAE